MRDNFVSLDILMIVLTESEAGHTSLFRAQVTEVSTVTSVPSDIYIVWSLGTVAVLSLIFLY